MFNMVLYKEKTGIVPNVILRSVRVTITVVEKTNCRV